MIERDRPICVQIPLNFQHYVYRELQRDLAETIETEDYGLEHRGPGSIVEACCAEWCKEGILDDHGFSIYVKCMEPASWFFSVGGNGVGCGSYCDYHKPKVRPLY